jgi:superfamily II DNA helicase RecQ
VAKLLCEHLGLQPKSLDLPQFRKLFCTLALQVELHLESLHRPLISLGEVAKAFNHSKTTHAVAYSQLVDGSEKGQVPILQLSRDLTLDLSFQRLMGFEGLESRPDKTYRAVSGTVVNPFELRLHQRLRLIDDSAAHGLLVLGGGPTMEKRAPTQRYMMTDALSNLRDSLFVLPCGSGKSSIIWAPHVYASFCRMVHLSSPGSLVEAMMARFELNNESAAEELLSHESVKALVSFAQADKCGPIPITMFTIVLEPTIALADDMVKCTNKVSGIKAIRWQRSNHEAMCSFISKCIHEHATGSCNNVRSIEYDVVVMTISFAAELDVCYTMQRAIMGGCIFQFVLDEAHTFVLNPPWQHSVLSFRSMPRGNVVVKAMTGTLHTALVSEFNACTHSTVGKPTIESLTGSQPNRVVYTQEFYSTLDHVKHASREWRDQAGLLRGTPAVPHCVRFGVIEVSAVDNCYCQNIAAMALQALATHDPDKSADDSYKSLSAKRVHILCGERSHVQMITSAVEILAPYFFDDWPAHSVCSLVGSDEPSNIANFHSRWTALAANDPGAARVAVTTTVAAMGINCLDCDLVIWSVAYFGAQMLLQGAARAGRRKQLSNCVVFHSSKSLSEATRRNPPDKFLLPYAEAGVNTNDPGIRSALSIDSMRDFLDSSSCRRRHLESAVSGPLLSDLVTSSTDYCCDVCDQEFKSALLSSFTSAKVMAESYRQEERMRMPPEILNDSADDAEIPSEMDEGEQSMHAQTRASQLESRSSAAQSIAAEREQLQGFLWDSPSDRCCTWHPEHPHDPTQEWWKIFALVENRRPTICLEKFCKFMDLRLPRCWKCFDKPHQSSKPCILHRKQQPGFGTSFCYSCGLCAETDTRHGGSHNNVVCNKDRHWGLVLWALRSVDGYDRVRTAFGNVIGANVSDFPARTPFLDEYRQSPPRGN